LDDFEARALRTQLASLERARQNLLAQLEAFEPTGDDEADTEWRTSLQKRITTITAEHRQAAARAPELQARPAVDTAPAGEQAALLDLLPITDRDLTQLPEEIQRQHLPGGRDQQVLLVGVPPSKSGRDYGVR
jgi:hypothetical protein